MVWQNSNFAVVFAYTTLCRLMILDLKEEKCITNLKTNKSFFLLRDVSKNW